MNSVQRQISNFFGFTAALLLMAGCGTGSQEPDPVVIDKPIAYVKRPVTEDSTTDIRVSQAFEAGGDLYIRDRAAPSASEYNITGGVTGGEGDVRDVSVSFEGDKLLFSLRLPLIEGADPEDQPTWNIWEYDITTGQLRRIMGSIDAELGHDRFPHYLPDGRIVFSSTRQRQAKARLTDEGLLENVDPYPAMEASVDEPAMVLHVMDADGNNDSIEQISFNRSHDFFPSVLGNGQIVFSRWDNADGNDAINLYRMNPDGTEMELFYGLNSHETGTADSTVQFMRPFEMPDGSLLSLLLPFDGSAGGGAMVLIDAANYVDNDQPTWVNTGLAGPAQSPATVHRVTTDGTPSIDGRLSSAFPLYDGTNRMLISWSQCRLMEGSTIVPCSESALAGQNVVEAPPLYGIFIYDMIEQTQQPIVAPQEGVIYTDVVAADARTMPPVIFDLETREDTDKIDKTLVSKQTGLLSIRSVYDTDGLDVPPGIATHAQTQAADRQYLFLRLIESVTIPDRDEVGFSVPASAFGVDRNYGMREIIGYAPIEPDGSVQVQVPANVPVSFELLDANGRKVGQNHPFWLQFRPGEVVICNGCHDPDSPIPHGRLSAAPPSVYAGAPAGGFPNTNTAMWVDEVGDTMAETRNRIECGGACEPTMDILFSDVWTPETGTPDPDINLSYAGLNTQHPKINFDICETDWEARCLTTINYEQHIHPLWSVNREVDDGMGNVIDGTCIACHTSDNAGTAMVPPAQLDLTDGPAEDEPDHFAAYHELLYQDYVQEVVGGILTYVMVDSGEIDDEGNAIMVREAVAGGARMEAGSASTGRFLGKFDVGGSHEGYLSDAEMRLIAEWLDIGAQYYNNPFDVPL